MMMPNNMMLKILKDGKSKDKREKYGITLIKVNSILKAPLQHFYKSSSRTHFYWIDMYLTNIIFKTLFNKSFTNDFFKFVFMYVLCLPNMNWRFYIITFPEFVR